MEGKTPLERAEAEVAILKKALDIAANVLGCRHCVLSEKLECARHRNCAKHWYDHLLRQAEGGE